MSQATLFNVRRWCLIFGDTFYLATNIMHLKQGIKVTEANLFELFKATLVLAAYKKKDDTKWRYLRKTFPIVESAEKELGSFSYKDAIVIPSQKKKAFQAIIERDQKLVKLPVVIGRLSHLEKPLIPKELEIKKEEVEIKKEKQEKATSEKESCKPLTAEERFKKSGEKVKLSKVPIISTQALGILGRLIVWGNKVELSDYYYPYAIELSDLGYVKKYAVELDTQKSEKKRLKNKTLQPFTFKYTKKGKEYELRCRCIL
jgi:hypothetical protein